jgi:hypothetical protein
LSCAEKCLAYEKQRAETTGIYDRAIAASHNMVAIGLMMNRDYQKAEDELKTALGILEKVVGENRVLMSSHTLNLGLCLWVQRKLDEAETVLKGRLACPREEIWRKRYTLL